MDCLLFQAIQSLPKAQAYNLGVEVAERQLFLCVDSDDFLLFNAVEKRKEIEIEKASKTESECEISLICHCPKLIQLKYFSILSRSILCEKHRPP